MNSMKTKLLIITALIAVAMLAMQSSSMAETAVNSPLGTGDELNSRIRDYLLNHPEVIVEALQRWQAQQQRALTERANATLKERREEIFHDPHSPIGGNPNGDVTVVAFMDYNCGYCRRVFPLLAQLLKDDTKVRLSFKEFPVLGPGSEFAARAALAAQKQGRYMEFHTALMQSKASLEEPQVLAIAEQVGLNLKHLKTDMADPETGQHIGRNLQLAQTLAINGTPGFVIGTEIVRGAADLATLQRLINQARHAR